MGARRRYAASALGLTLAAGALVDPRPAMGAEEGMVVGTISEWRSVPGTEGFAKVFGFLESTDLRALPPGRHPIEDDDIFALVSVGETRAPDAAQFEGHRRYIDVQCVVEGQEAIGVASTASLVTSVPYDEGKDIEFFVNPPTFQKIEMHAGSFAILFPGQAHLPSLHLDGPHQVRKVVVKVSLAYLQRQRAGQ
jgi:biofilm protein TabA